MLSFYPQFWTKAFDFKGRTKRIDFWRIIIANLFWRFFSLNLLRLMFIFFFCRINVPWTFDEHLQDTRYRQAMAVDFYYSRANHWISLDALDSM